MIQMYTVLLSTMYNATNSASVVEIVTYFLMWAMLSTVPLLVGTVDSLERKKCPPALLLALVRSSNVHHYVLRVSCRWRGKLGQLLPESQCNPVAALFASKCLLLALKITTQWR